MIKRVRSWAHYKANWKDYGECMAEIILELAVAVMCVVLFAAGSVLVALGYAPTEEED